MIKGIKRCYWMLGRLLKFLRLLRNGIEVCRYDPERPGVHAFVRLAFRHGPDFAIRDPQTAKWVLQEVFFTRDYASDRLPKAKIVVDVGANIGLTSYFFYLQAPDAQIHSFEADPANFSILSGNLLQINVDNRIHLNQVAVSDSDKVIEFYSSAVSGWSSRYQVRGAESGVKVIVQSVKLSAYLREHGIVRVDLLKVDIEGGEYDLLMGDTDLWSVVIEEIIVEVDRQPREGIGYSFDDLVAFLGERYVDVLEIKGGDYPVFRCQGPRSR